MVKMDLNWTVVQSAEIEQTNFRLEASAFNIEAKKAKDDLKRCKYELTTICGEGGLATAYRPGICKRIYVNRGNGVPMFTPSEMVDLNPRPQKYLSLKTNTDLNSWYLKEFEILLSCSGTIGNVAFVTDTLKGKCFSQNLIRIVPFTFGGYIYAFLRTKAGRLIIQTNNYGAVIQHIDPEHLKKVPIPNPLDEIKKRIHENVLQSFRLRDEGNRLIEQAENILIAELQLPPFNDIKPDLYAPGAGVQTYTVNLNLLDDRFEASYHVPIVSKIIDSLLDSGAKIMPLGSEELTKNIYVPNRFKRIYVEDEEGVGIPFFTGKCLHELDPANKKYISSTLHKDRIGSQLLIKEGMILVTRSGTTGKVNIVPKHWDNWVITDDIIRIIPTNKETTGYIYVWLNSEYGHELIKRNEYGSVVPHLESEHLQRVQIPLLKNVSKIKEINDLALRAIELRSEAYELEQIAVRQVNEDVIYAR